MSAAVRVALLGLGRMGQVHAAAAARVPDLDVVAVAEPNPTLRAKAPELLGADVACYESATDALAHDGLDGCVIAAPTPSHPELTQAALLRNLHVFCEKPLSLDPIESATVGEAADAAGKLLQVGFWRRFSAPWEAAKRVLDSGEIGRPVWARSSQWDAVVAPIGFCDPRVSGGLIVDFGVHDFDLIEWLTGERIVSVATDALRLVEPELESVGDLDNALVRLTLTGGVAGLVDLSRNAAYGDDVRTEILGERGAVFVDTLPRGGLRIGDANGMRNGLDAPVEDTFVAGIGGELAAFAAAVAGSRASDDLPGASASTRALNVALAARESARTGEPVAVEGERS